MAGEIRNLMLNGPVGRLEAILNVGAGDARFSALICHPHPLHGGTIHNKVVYNAMKALTAFGFHALRFNFRGTGLSEGTHDEGHGEQDDVRAAVDFLHNEFHLPIIFAGFSFGSSVGLRATCPDLRVVGAISLGTPVFVNGRSYTYGFLRECTKPKLFLSGDADPYSPRVELEAAVANAVEPKKLVIIPNTEHFFAGKLAEMQTEIKVWISDTYKL
jgi:alpha/beta superfamily hydrolase